MGLDPPPFGPGIGPVVMVHIGDQQAGGRLVQDQADVPVDPRGPEVGVLRLVDPVHLQPRRRRIELQIHHAHLDGLLLGSGQPGERGGEGVGKAEVQAHPSLTSSVGGHSGW